jgi:hypothetical protein
MRGRHDDGGQVRVVGDDLLQERLTRQVRHGQVEHHHPKRVVCHPGQDQTAVVQGQDGLNPRSAQEQTRTAEQGGFIVDQ